MDSAEGAGIRGGGSREATHCVDARHVTVEQHLIEINEPLECSLIRVEWRINVRSQGTASVQRKQQTDRGNGGSWGQSSTHPVRAPSCSDSLLSLL